MDLLQKLQQDLKSESAKTREAAVDSLHDLGEESRPLFGDLLQALLLENDFCGWLGTAIVKIGPQASDIPALRKGLQHPNDHVRFWTARAIVKLGEARSPLTVDLIQCLLDSHTPVVDSTMWALWTIGPSAIEHLIQTVETAAAPLQKKAIMALSAYSDHLPQKVPTICKALESGDPEVRSAAAYAVCRLVNEMARERERSASLPVELSKLLKAVRSIVVDDTFCIDRKWLPELQDWYNPPSENSVDRDTECSE